MSNGIISKIQLPDGNKYDLAGEQIPIDSSYDSNTKTVTIIWGESPAGVTITQDSTTGILTIV